MGWAHASFEVWALFLISMSEVISGNMCTSYFKPELYTIVRGIK